MKCGNLILAEKGPFFYIHKAIKNEIQADSCQSHGPAAGMGYVSDGFVYSCITRFLKTYFAIGSLLYFYYLMAGHRVCVPVKEVISCIIV